ncbi:ankyrin repeat domain-containing protein 17-like isoform X2 [Cylas formicarius]|uniref:ankyrin repeat domain-containing protein 17-like isoform X2 n=1 Tax=Cylas formicarius TaxID=197179 RepID=UPI002958DB2D|nr:ankyrin repeat domain-containing protein 17-like isoform X2 [Cylas formicarius]
MQNESQHTGADESKLDKVNNQHDIAGNITTSSTPQSTNSTPTKSETETYSEKRRFMSETSESEEDSVSEVESFMIDQEFEDDPQVEAAKFLLNPDEDRAVDPETQARLEALLQAAGIGQLTAKDGKALGDPEVLRRLTSSVSCALDEAAAALTRMRSDNAGGTSGNGSAGGGGRPQTAGGNGGTVQPPAEKTSLVEACTDGDVGTVKKLLTEGRSVHETSEEGESLLSLACSAGYFELAQVLLAMHANVEDRGIKGECTPLMEAASAGHLDIVRLLVHHGADVNAQSTSGNTPLMYACAGGHTDVVKFLLENGANVEDHNENGHTPLMEAASAGHVGLAKILLMHGAGINTHSNEFKESALTLACYKGHLDMVRFLLEAGADQEHKTDEMHTALMEASMDGHVEVARLLLDSGAQVNMPTDSFESPLTLAACGGHVDLAMLLIERGANIEEVNDEGYTPLMEAAREGHEEMVHLLLGQGANINAQTDETQETALTLACCGGFTEVADILLKGGANIELGASTPLMEAAQEGHLDLVRFLLEYGANVNAVTQTNDTALTYACENGHTDVADLLLQYGADLEHESEGGRTPLMKACRAGHLCTVQFLISKGANVRKQTTNNDHTPLSLACAGGHLTVVELLLGNNADLNHRLKDNSTMLIEAARGGHTSVVKLLLDYPHSIQPIMLNQHQQQPATAATNLSMLPGQVGSRDSPVPPGGAIPPNLPAASFFQPPAAVLQEVPEAVRIVQQVDINSPTIEVNAKQQIQQAGQRSATSATGIGGEQVQQPKSGGRKSILPKSRSTGAMFDGTLTSAEVQQVRTPPLSDFEEEVFSATEFLNKEDPNGTLLDFIKNRKKFISDPDGNTQKQQILEELHRVERELHGKQQQQQQQAAHNHIFQYAIPQDQCQSTGNPNGLPLPLNFDIAIQQQKQQQGIATPLPSPSGLKLAGETAYNQPPPPGHQPQQQQPAFYFAPLAAAAAATTATSTGVSLPATPTTVNNVITGPAPGLGTLVSASSIAQPIKFQSVGEVSQNTAINDRPKVKPIKKEGKNIRKQQQQQQIALTQSPPQANNPAPPKPFNLFADQQIQMFRQLQIPPQQQQQRAQQCPKMDAKTQELLSVQDLDVQFLKEDQQESLLTASILQQFHNTSIPFIRAASVGSPQKTRLEVYDPSQDGGGKVTKLELSEKDFSSVDDMVQTLEVQPYPAALDESMIASLTAAQQADLQAAAAAAAAASAAAPGDLQRVEYFAVPAPGGPAGAAAQVPVHALYPYEHYLAAGMAPGLPKDQIYQAGFQAGYSLMQQQLACPPNVTTNESLSTTASIVPTSAAQQQQQYMTPVTQVACPGQQQGGVVVQGQQQQQHHCQPCGQHQQQQQQGSNQVQAATQTLQTTVANCADGKKMQKVSEMKFKKGRALRHQSQGASNFQQQPDQNYQIDHNSAITQYSGGGGGGAANGTRHGNNIVITPIDLDSQTDSNHDTALTLAASGGHDELVELLVSRGADIEHRDKKGLTSLILAATGGHEKVVEVLLNHNADIEAYSERTKDTALSLACSGGRYEVVELLLTRQANKEHRNISDYTPLSLAASGGYVNIIKLLLSHGAEINSRTGSKLGISPLMLAAMNGHTAAVKLLLDMGSDINAQIETNRNTALTLACFQGRHEVVSLLLDRKANVEHRAKTGLTPLMEAASGGYVDVGRVLLDKGADVNATPVPSSRDTALTIAADKGHVRFVELLLCRGAQVEVKNKKGNSPLWLAANGGHLPVVELLYNVNADIDSQDNRKVSCLMAAFRKGHVKVVKWMVHHVTQFPSDQEMMRYIATISDKELLEKCHECVKIIRAAKETQAVKANKNASILLEELESEKTREESKRLAAAKRRERKKKKRLEKKEERRKLLEENKKNENYDEKQEEKIEEEEKVEEEDSVPEVGHNQRNGAADSNDKEEGDSGIDANSQGSCSSNDIKAPKEKRKNKKNKKVSSSAAAAAAAAAAATVKKDSIEQTPTARTKPGSSKESEINPQAEAEKQEKDKGTKGAARKSAVGGVQNEVKAVKSISFEASTKSPAERDDFEATGNEVYVSSSKVKKSEDNPPPQSNKGGGLSTSPKQSSKREEGWKEVVRKSSVQTVSESGVKKVSVPLNAISRVIGRGGSNINAIRAYTGAHIEVEKQSKGQGERIITIKGSTETTKQAHNLITALIKDPEVDIMSMVPKTSKSSVSTTTLWDKTQIATKKNAGKVASAAQSAGSSSSSSAGGHPKSSTQTAAGSAQSGGRFNSSASTAKYRTSAPGVAGRVTAPRLVAQAEKNAQAQANLIRMPPSSTAPASRLALAKVVQQTFAAKVTEALGGNQATSSNPAPPVSGAAAKSRVLAAPPVSSGGSLSPQPPTVVAAASLNHQNSPNKNARPAPTASAPPTMQHFHTPSAKPQSQTGFGTVGQQQNQPASAASDVGTVISASSVIHPVIQQQQQEEPIPQPLQTTSEYTLFCSADHWNRREQEQQKPINFAAVTGGGGAAQSVNQHKFIDQEPPPQVDASKAPGYRGVAVCSPVSSKASSNSTTPPNLSANSSFQTYQEPSKPQNPLPPIGSRPQVTQNPTAGQDFMAFMDFKAANILNLNHEPQLLHSSFNPIQNLSFSQPQQQSANMSRLNPKAPEYSYSSVQTKPAPHNVYNGYQMNMQNNVFVMKGAMDSFHRGSGLAGSSSQNRSWMQIPPPFTQQQSEQLISGLAGMTIQNLHAKFQSSEGLENGAELGMVHSSPNMSPNMAAQPHPLHPDAGGHFVLEERKPPQPIGTERARKAYNSAIDQNWALNDNKQAKWSGNLAEFGMRPPMYAEDATVDFPRPMQMDNFMNGPQYFHQPPLANIRHDFIPDMPKLDLPSWDNTRPLSDLQDKQHGWTNQWNK